jgi:glutathione peroxidase
MGLYDIPVTTLDGRVITLEVYSGKVLLIVNVAAAAASLRSIAVSKNCTGVIGIGLSFSDFRAISSVDRSQGTKQTSGRSAQNSTTSRSRCFAKIDVNGAAAHPLYRYLKSERKACWGANRLRGTSPSSS